jgi:uncharacterized protein YdeI (YjbR/CyaY-like superfamily)
VTPQFFADPEALRAWFLAHADEGGELLVGYWKTGTGRPSVTWPESVDEALCVGWIDGVRRRLDDDSYVIRFTPRRPGSTWSSVNVARVAELTAQGRSSSSPSPRRTGTRRPGGWSAPSARVDDSAHGRRLARLSRP